MGMVQGLGFSRGLEKTGFRFLWFLLFSVPLGSSFELTSKKQKIQTKLSLEFRISRLRDKARIPQRGEGPKAPPPWGKKACKDRYRDCCEHSIRYRELTQHPLPRTITGHKANSDLVTAVKVLSYLCSVSSSSFHAFVHGPFGFSLRHFPVPGSRKFRSQK